MVKIPGLQDPDPMWLVWLDEAGSLPVYSTAPLNVTSGESPSILAEGDVYHYGDDGHNRGYFSQKEDSTMGKVWKLDFEDIGDISLFKATLNAAFAAAAQGVSEENITIGNVSIEINAPLYINNTEVTPQNYKEFEHYVEGANGALDAAMDQAIGPARINEPAYAKEREEMFEQSDYKNLMKHFEGSGKSELERDGPGASADTHEPVATPEKNMSLQH